MENNSSGFEIVSAYNKRPCLKLGKLTMPILNWTSVSSSINPMTSGNDNFITVALPGNVFNTPIEIKLKGYYSIYPSFDDSTRIESQDSIKILLDAFEESCSLFSTPIKHTPKATKEPEVARLIKLLKINDTYKDLYLIQPLKDRVGDLEKRMNGAERTTERNRQELQETILRIQEETASQIQDLADLHNPPLQLRRTLEAIKHMSSDKYLY
jgi:hypothetical protein